MRIRKDIPVPTKESKAGRKPIYPFADLEVGDSFPIEEGKLLAARTAAWRQNKNGKLFRVDRHRNAWRCWRVA